MSTNPFYHTHPNTQGTTVQPPLLTPLSLPLPSPASLLSSTTPFPLETLAPFSPTGLISNIPSILPPLLPSSSWFSQPVTPQYQPALTNQEITERLLLQQQQLLPPVHTNTLQQHFTLPVAVPGNPNAPTTTTTTTTMAFTTGSPNLRTTNINNPAANNDMKLDLKLNFDFKVGPNGVATLRVNANAIVSLPGNNQIVGTVPIPTTHQTTHQVVAAIPGLAPEQQQQQHHYNHHHHHHHHHNQAKRHHHRHHHHQTKKRRAEDRTLALPPATTTSSSSSSSSSFQTFEFFEFLPVEIALHIFSFLSSSDLCRLSIVSKSMKLLVGDNQLWKSLCIRDFSRYEQERMITLSSRRTSKHLRDPNAPKKNLSSYLLYCQDHRSDVRKANPGIGFAEITKILAQRWRNLSSREKQAYSVRSQQDKTRFEKELVEYLRLRTLGLVGNGKEKDQDEEEEESDEEEEEAVEEGEKENGTENEKEKEKDSRKRKRKGKEPQQTRKLVCFKERYQMKSEERKQQLRLEKEEEEERERRRNAGFATTGQTTKTVSYEFLAILRGGVSFN